MIDPLYCWSSWTPKQARAIKKIHRAQEGIAGAVAPLCGQAAKYPWEPTRPPTSEAESCAYCDGRYPSPHRPRLP